MTFRKVRVTDFTLNLPKFTSTADAMTRTFFLVMNMVRLYVEKWSVEPHFAKFAARYNKPHHEYHTSIDT